MKRSLGSTQPSLPGVQREGTALRRAPPNPSERSVLGIASSPMRPWRSVARNVGPVGTKPL